MESVSAFKKKQKQKLHNEIIWHYTNSILINIKLYQI